MVGRKYLAALVVVLGIAVSASQAMAKQDILFGGASTTEINHQVALQLSRMMNKHAADKYNYIGRPTGGSVFNINAIDRGAFDFAVTQSDRNWQGFNGAADWEGKNLSGLRSVFSMHPETVLLVTRKDADIKTVMDMKGKRINIGNPGSGQRGNAEDVLRIYGLDFNKDFHAETLHQAEASRALIDHKIDAFFFTAGNPSAVIEEPARSVELELIPLNSNDIKGFVDKHPYYIMTKIPAGTYTGVGKDVETYAVTTTIITNESMSEEVVYDMVKTVFENLDELKASHAAFRNLDPREMLQGLSTPLHPGAIKYYKEKGWR